MGSESRNLVYLESQPTTKVCVKPKESLNKPYSEIQDIRDTKGQLLDLFNITSISDIGVFLLAIWRKLATLEKVVLERNKPFLSINEASKYTNIPKNTLYQYTSNNVLPYYKIGKRVFFKVEDLDNFILDKKNKIFSADEIGSQTITSLYTTN